MEDNYQKAYKEVIEILNFVPKESVEKIPDSILKTFKAKMDTTWNFKVDINKEFEEQNLLEETKAILANIFRDYWATPYQKERIKAKEDYDRQKIEEDKKIKYDSNDIFSRRDIKNTKNDEQNNENTNLPMEIKKEKFFEKIIKFFKRIFHISGGK